MYPHRWGKIVKACLPWKNHVGSCPCSPERGSFQCGPSRLDITPSTSLWPWRCSVWNVFSIGASHACPKSALTYCYLGLCGSMSFSLLPINLSLTRTRDESHSVTQTGSGLETRYEDCIQHMRLWCKEVKKMDCVKEDPTKQWWRVIRRIMKTLHISSGYDLIALT